jgi:Luciferase-like monooxygenase
MSNSGRWHHSPSGTRVLRHSQRGGRARSRPVAKQAVAVDLLSGGKLRLGVAVGWNEAEFDGLGGPTYRRRGRYIDEQITLLRQLWANDTDTTRTQVERLDNVGINPRPARSIPIWMGGLSRAALEQAGRIADGWISQKNWSDQQAERVGWMHDAAAAIGRRPQDLALDGVLSMWRTTRDRCGDELAGGRPAGAEVLTANPLKLGLRRSEHVTVLEHFAEDVGLRRR